MSVSILTSDQRQAPRRPKHRSLLRQPSVREVCLIGIARSRPEPTWTKDEQVIWSGRHYLIVQTQRPADEAAPTYVHLTASGDNSS
jgi:hypothetical protein